VCNQAEAQENQPKAQQVAHTIFQFLSCVNGFFIVSYPQALNLVITALVVAKVGFTLASLALSFVTSWQSCITSAPSLRCRASSITSMKLSSVAGVEAPMI